LNLSEYLQDPCVLVFKLSDLARDEAVLIRVLDQLSRLLNLVKFVDETIGELSEPLVELRAHFNEHFPYPALPTRNETTVRRILLHHPMCHLLNAFILLHVALVLLIHVDQIFLLQHAAETTPFVKLAREEDCRLIVVEAVDSKLGVDHFFAVGQELLLNYAL